MSKDRDKRLRAFKRGNVLVNPDLMRQKINAKMKQRLNEWARIQESPNTAATPAEQEVLAQIRPFIDDRQPIDRGMLSLMLSSLIQAFSEVITENTSLLLTAFYPEHPEAEP